MFPGIYGDKAELVEFQARLSVSVSIEIIELQSLEEPRAELSDMEAIGLAAAHEIERRSPQWPLMLAGYSFGGSVAFEAARHLISSGRSVCFLGIIDVLNPRPETHYNQRSSWGRFFRLVGKIYAGGYGGFSSLCYRLLRELLGRSCSSDFRLRHLLTILSAVWPSRARFFRRMLLFHFRRQAVERWRPTPIQAPVFLAFSQENSSAIDQWNSLCPQACVIRLPGTHIKIFQPPSLEILLSEFGKAVL